MPQSMTADYACDVVKEGGDDGSHAGPFKTIGRAIEYLVDNFTNIDSTHRGIIYIAPGIYDEAGDVISLTTNDRSRFIDFVGAERDTTILRSSTSTVVTLGGSGITNENRFYKLTIYHDSSSGLCFNIGDDVASVRIQDCKIFSHDACFYNVGSNTKIHNCEIESDTTNVQNIIDNFKGEMTCSTIKANYLSSYGLLFHYIHGTVEYCTLNTISASTAYDVNCIEKLTGKISYCNIEAQGMAINQVEGGVIEYCYLSTEGGDSTPDKTCVGYFNDARVLNSHFYQKADADLSVVARGSITSGITKVFDSTFNAPNTTTADVIGSIEVDGSCWENCQIISSSSATAGYSLAANALDRQVIIKNIVSNRPIDPQIRLTDNGLESKTLGEAKGYCQKRWWAINCSGAQIVSLGIPSQLFYTSLLNDNNANGPASRLETGSIAGDSAWVITGFTGVQRQHNPTLYVKFQLHSTTDVRFWCGLFNTAIPGNVDNPSNECAAVRYSSVYPDYNFEYYTRSNSTNEPVTDGPAINTDMHTLKIHIDNSTSKVFFQMDNQDVEMHNTEIPAVDTDLGFCIQVTATTTTLKAMTLYSVWCEYNA